MLSDARGVHLKLEEYQIHEVATALKRFFRQLPDPLLTGELYPKWINTASKAFRSHRVFWLLFKCIHVMNIHGSRKN